MNPPDTQNKVAKKKRKPRKPSDNKLSPDQKRQNHVSSEQRRRQAMRETYDTLVELVPDLCDAEKRSEFMIYAKSMCVAFVFFFGSSSPTRRKTIPFVHGTNFCRFMQLQII